MKQEAPLLIPAALPGNKSWGRVGGRIFYRSSCQVAVIDSYHAVLD